MKATKRILLPALLLFALLLSACGSSGGPPDIRVRAGEGELTWVMGLNRWDGSVIDRMDNYDLYMSRNKELTRLELGTEITVEFQGKAPDSVTLRDELLNSDGSRKYDERVSKVLELAVVDGGVSFSLEPHFAVFLSSSLEDYEPGAVIRGLKLTCSWGENECEYAFAIRTDPGM